MFRIKCVSSFFMLSPDCYSIASQAWIFLRFSEVFGGESKVRDMCVECEGQRFKDLSRKLKVEEAIKWLEFSTIIT